MLKDRADKILADLKLVASRSQAKSLIEKGDVLVNGNVLLKASELISSEDHIEIKSPLFVGRGAFKLEKALEVFPIEVKDLTLMDVGASTGGFTEVLLQKGAKKVFAIDVGHDQLAKKLREDPRVVNLEGTNIKDLKTLPDEIDGAVMDLSFISMTKVLEALHGLMKEGAFLIALVKPQFEAGPERLPKDGVVKDQKLRDQILNDVIQFSETYGWKHHQSIISPIEGKNGNQEFLIWLTRL